MKILSRRLIAFLYTLSLLITPALGDPNSDSASVVDIRAEGEDIVLQMSQLMPYEAYLLESPWRLVIEVKDAKYAAGFKMKNVNTSLVTRIRGYQFKENPLVSRVILDLKAPVDYKTNAQGSQVIVSLKRNNVLSTEAKNPAGLKTRPARSSR